MTQTLDDQIRRRFLRTLRVATGTLMAEYNLAQGRPAFVSVASFRALAAKGEGDWRFPDAGLSSSDGLLQATVARAQDGKPTALDLQAQGSAGLSLFAGRSVELAVEGYPPLAGTFDRLGRLRLELPGTGIGEEELARFELRFSDDGQ